LRVTGYWKGLRHTQTVSSVKTGAGRRLVIVALSMDPFILQVAVIWADGSEYLLPLLRLE
jgi:hypothetical protein